MTHPVSQSGGRHRRPRLLLLLLVAGLLAAGLASGLGSALAADPSASPAGDKVVLHVGWTNDPDNLNPFIGAETSSYEIWLLNYDFLTGYSLDLQPTPDLATSWETSPDGKIWTFHLRDGVKWQDGEPFTADDVAFTYNYIVDNRDGRLLESDHVHRGGRGHRRPHRRDPLQQAQGQHDPHLDPHPARARLEQGEPQGGRRLLPDKPPIIGTGPFQTVEVKKGDYVRMVANPTFWGQKPTIDEILFVTYQNPDTMTQDLLSGNLDAAWGIPSAQFPKLENTEGFEAISYNLLTWTYLAMNCYEGQSRGNPVLKDVAFRQALNWAIDRQKVVDLAWAGRGEPGTTIMTPDSWVDPDYHWQPPADVLYTYDPAKAQQLLDDAGYMDGDGDGIREDKSGKPIKLRLWARAESPESQKTGSLMTGWFRDLGLKIEYQVMDDGVYYDSIWGYEGNTYSPDFDLYLWDWDGYADPGDTLASFITSQIENWNEPCWSNAEFDAVVDEANTTLDPEQRKELIWRAQQIFYEESPEIAVDYPDKLEAIDTAHWDGWTRMYDGTGAAFYTSYIRDSYLNLKPKAAAATEEAGGAGGLVIAIIAAVVLLAVVVVAWLLVRWRRQAAEEE